MKTAVDILNRFNTYNLQVNADLIAHLKQVNPENERIMLLISHLVNAHQIWLERIEKKSMSVKVFEIRDLDTLMLQNKANHELTKKMIEEYDLEAAIQYVNTKRQRFENSISEMFMHLFNHATYHRGQINQLLVQEGKPAMVSDFIVYNRKEIL